MTQTTKVIRVYNQGESSTQRRAFENARDEVSRRYDPSRTSEIIFEAKNITQIVNRWVNRWVIWLRSLAFLIRNITIASTA